MDFSKLQGLLETKESIEIDDNDLEDELNAIISGHSSKPTNKPQQTTTSSSSRNVKQKDYKRSDNKLPNKRQNTNQNECKSNLTFLQLYLNMSNCSIKIHYHVFFTIVTNL